MSEGSGQEPPAPKPARWAVLLRGTLRWTVGLALLLPLLVAALVLALYIPAIQAWAKDKAIAKVSGMTGAAIQLEALHLRFPLGLSLEGLHVPDVSGDTLLNAGSITVDVSLSDLLAKRINLRSVSLAHVRARLLRDAEGRFNFDHIVEAFTSGDTTPPDPSSGPGWGFTIGSVDLMDVDYDMGLGPEGPDMTVRLAHLHVTMDALDLDTMRFHLRESRIEGAHMVLRTVSGEPKPDIYPDLVNPVDGFDIRSGPLLLDDVSFALVDAFSGDSLWLDARSLLAEPGVFDLSKQHVPFERIVATGFHFGMLDHASVDPVPVHKPPFQWPGRDDGFRFYLQDWDAEVKQLLVSDGRFEMHSDSILAPTGITDARHMVFTDLVLDAHDLVARNDHLSIDVRVMHASTVEGPVDMTATLDLVPQGLRTADAFLAFGEQSVRLKANAEWSDMAMVFERPERIAFRSDLNVRITSDPLVELLSQAGITVKGMNALHSDFTLQANAAGSMQALDTLGLYAWGSDGTELQVTGAVGAPLDVDHLSYDVHLHRFLMGAGIRRFVTAWVPEGTVVPRRVALDLDAKGTVRNADTRIDLRTDLGDAKGTAVVWGLGGDIPDGYRVDMKLADLRLANLLGDTTWGTMGFHIQGAGQDLATEQRQAWLDLEPDSFIYEGKDFSALCLSAGVEGDSVHASVDLNARPLGFMMYAKAGLPKENDSLRVAVDLAMDHIHLRELGLTDHVLRLGGDWHFSAARASDGGLQVTGDMDSTLIWNLEKKVLLEELDWAFGTSRVGTTLDVSGDAVEATVRSNMALDTILMRMEQRLARHFSATAVVPITVGEQVQVDLAMPRTDWLTDLVVPDLHAVTLERCHLRYDGDSDHLEADIRVPHLLYDSVLVDTIVCRVDADAGDFDATLDVTRARYGDYSVEGVELDLGAEAGVTDVQLEVMGGNSSAAGASGPLFRMGVEVVKQEEVMEFRLHDRLVMDGRDWRSDPDDLLRIGPATVDARNFSITDGTERIALETDDQVELVLQRFHLQNLLGLVSTGDTLPIAGGVLDGRVRLPLQGAPLGAQLVVTDLQALGVDIGKLMVGVKQPDVEHLAWSATLERGVDRVEASGGLALAGSSGMEARARLNMADLSWAQGFVEEYLTALKGGVRGDVAMSWKAGKLGLDGRLDLDQLRIGVRQLGQTFSVPGGALVMSGSLISLSDLVVIDSLQEAFHISGSVMVADPSLPVLDLGLRTERFRWVHSASSDNAQFFGDFFAGLDLAIKGRALMPSITGQVSVLPGTDFTLVMPGSKVEMVDGEGVVIFTDDPYRQRVDSAEVMRHALQDSLQALFGAMEVDLKILVDKDARFAVMLDPVSGDQATVRGMGNMQFRYGKDRKMVLDGSFIVEEGGYTLSLYGMVRKRFDLIKHGVVRWNGDPMNGVMEFSALYKSSTAPLALVEDEVALSESERNRYRKPLPFQVYIDLRGTFLEPDIAFRLDLPAIDRKNYPKVGSILDKLAQRGNEEMLNRQVFGLLVLNSFIPTSAASDEGNLSGSEIASSTARNSVNGLLTQQLNSLSGQHLKNIDISVGVNSYEQSQGGSSYQRTSVDYKVSQHLFDDRVTVEVGGSVGVDEKANKVGAVTNTNTMNYAIGYALTPDGRYRARMYHEPGYDLYDGEITISGISVQYTKELPGRGKARMRKHGPKVAEGTPTDKPEEAP